MTIVCQQCGALGWEDRLIYCSRCSNAAQHLYCVDTIPEPDQEIEWSCEDCNCRSINQASEEICRSPKIHRDCINLSPDSNAFSIRDENKLFISNNRKVISKNLCASDLQVTHVSNKSNDRLNLHSLEKREQIEMDDVEGLSCQSFDWSKPNIRRRKSVLGDEDDDTMDDIENESSMKSEMDVLENTISLIHSFEKSKLKNHRRRLILIVEEREHSDYEVSSLKETIVSSKNGGATNFESESDDSVRRLSKNVMVADKPLRNLAFNREVQNSTISESDFYCISSRAIRSCIWRGWLKIRGEAYGPLNAYMSKKAGEKVWNATRSLPSVIELTTVSRLHAWPKSFEISPPTDDHIALFFFPPDSRVEKMVNPILQDVIKCDLALKVVLGEAELLILPSIFLPREYKRFQDKYYLWGVFKRKG